MTQKIRLSGLFLVFLSCFILFSLYLAKQREDLLSQSFVEYTMLSEIAGPASFEFKGLAADFLLFKFMTFMGGKIAEKAVISDRQWESIVATLDTITDLDPYFWDAYLFSEVFLAWGARRYKDANRLLLKGTRYIQNDYRIFYYLGFNYYYFLKDIEKGRRYLMEAARRPGASSYIASLAARLSVISDKHRDGIDFLKEMLKDARDKTTRDKFQLRINALEIMDHLESSVGAYKRKFNRFPGHLNELVSSGFISHIPKDPYGGEFIILENGRVYTTSNMRLKKTPEKK